MMFGGHMRLCCVWDDMASLNCLDHCSIIFCEAVAIYGIIVAIILQTKIDWVPPSPDTGLWSNESYLAGYAIFASGLTTGWANLACG
jgi:V-type H+-transporting ATPase 21kDa proteolipid subunit